MMYELHMVEEKMVCVTDDWFPNYPGDKIKVIVGCFYNRKQRDGYVFVSACGADDDMMTLEYRVFNERIAKDMYDSLKDTVYDEIPDKVNHQWFKEHGFKYLSDM